MVRFQMVDDLEVLFFHAAEVELLDVDEPQQLANRLGHRAAAFVTRAAALRYAYPGPEFLLVQAQTPADFPRVHELKEFHVRCATLKYGNGYANCMERAKADKWGGQDAFDPYVRKEFTIKFKDFFRGRDGAYRTKIRRDFGRHYRTDQGRRR